MSTQTMAEPERKRNKSTSTMSTQTTAEPEGKRNTSTSTMSTQIVEESEGQLKLIAVAPVQKRKSKTKSVHIVNDEEEAGPSHPAIKMKPEIITWCLSPGELRELRREFTRQANAFILTWLLCIWDAVTNDTILDGSEARQLRSLSQDVVIDQGIGKWQETLSLSRRLLSSVRERYL
ncbi:ubiquitin carboxyl-terminal hydrolase 4 [Willisornis vidua]|uniref:Ubiquitin carboxyl-terminal hydrolase 4 n=1 Tax=Willisornis vidua TaxID=1566151 RepID=A0ABQ9DJP3_9PASS|nr:ubiquitin carboxyl-terminal hydrolase 4 [Willisornis vidua]